METAIKDIKNLKVHGRTTKKRDPLTLFWTASGFECNVSGTELWVEVEVTYDTFEPWFSYTINGEWVGRQMLPKGRYWILLFRGMSAEKIKNIRFYKDLQAMSDDGGSYIHIHALRHDGEFYPVEEKKLKIEFIGDSITSGEGAIGAKEEEDWIPMFFSAIRNYTYLTARELDAEYRVISQSGWGVYCSWDGDTKRAIPKYYRQVCGLMWGERNDALGGSKVYDFSEWQPDVVVVNLGTNDAGANAPVPDFQKAVKDFLYTLRECNRSAQIIWCYGMLGDTLWKEISDTVADYVRETGDRKVSCLTLPNTDESTVGARQHPGILSHEQSAKVLSDSIRQLL